MRTFEHAPQGVAGSNKEPNSFPVPTGWRKVTPHMTRTERFAELGKAQAIEKGRAFVAVKRVGAFIGLKAADMMLLDTLGAFTQPQDWNETQSSIVWPSNALLIEQTGFSLSALKRHMRKLADVGVIAFKDSPNGKRWGHRGRDGLIVEAYGLDLSPLAARAQEFEALYAERQAERSLCKRLKRQITVTRRIIRARINAAIELALSGPWARLNGTFDHLLGALSRRMSNASQLNDLLTQFQALSQRIENLFQASQNDSNSISQPTQTDIKMNPKVVNNDPHTPTTNQLQSVTGNTDYPRSEKNSPIKPEPAKSSLTLQVIMQACPEFATWVRTLGGYLKDWHDLHRKAGELRPMIGITPETWNVVQRKLGLQAATAALAIVFEKHAAGEVTSPGGYLQGMVRKAEQGKLCLERSFFARLSTTEA